MGKTKKNNTKRVIPENEEFENFRMYHQLQYDRIDKLESRRETFSNFVITISAGIYLVGFGDLSKLNLISGIFLPVIISLINLSSIIFAHRSKHYIKMHQERAKIARAEYAPQLNSISSKVEKIDSMKDPLRRDMIYRYLHVSIIVIAILSVLGYFYYGIKI